MGEELNTVLSMAGTLILMVAVFAGAYFASKWFAKKYNPSGGTAAGNIEVLDRTALGKDQYLILVRVAGRVYLLGVASQQITKIEELDPENLRFQENTPKTAMDFGAMLKEAFGKQGLKK